MTDTEFGLLVVAVTFAIVLYRVISDVLFVRRIKRQAAKAKDEYDRR